MAQGTNRAQLIANGPLHRPSEALFNYDFNKEALELLQLIPEFAKHFEFLKSNPSPEDISIKTVMKISVFMGNLYSEAKDYSVRWKFSSAESKTTFEKNHKEILVAISKVLRFLEMEGSEGHQHYGIGSLENTQLLPLYEEVWDSESGNALSSAENTWIESLGTAQWVLEHARNHIEWVRSATGEKYFVERQRRSDPAAKLFVHNLFGLYAKAIDTPSEEIPLSVSESPGSEAMQFMRACVDLFLVRNDGSPMTPETIVRYVKNR